MPTTRLGLSGHATRRVGSFAGKTPSAGGGAHPVGTITRLGSAGYGVRRCGRFAGKTPSAVGGDAHPVGIITRLGPAGYGVRRCGSFVGKTTAIPASSVTGTHYGAVPRRRLDRNKEIMLMLAAVLPILDD